MKEQETDLPLLKRHVNILSLAVLAQFVPYWIYQLLMAKGLINLPAPWDRLLSLFILYVVLFGVMYLVSRNAKAVRPQAKKPARSDYLLAVCIILASTPILLILRLAEKAIFGEMTQQNIGAFDWVYFVTVLLVAPISEELSNRKIIGDRTIHLSEGAFLLLSATLFGIIHLVSSGLPITVSTFILGFAFAWLYLKTGNILISMVFHSLYNLVFGIAIQALNLYVSPIAAGLYNIVFVIAGIAALIYLIINRRKLHPAGGWRDAAKTVYTSPMLWLFVIVTIVFRILRRGWI